MGFLRGDCVLCGSLTVAFVMMRIPSSVARRLICLGLLFLSLQLWAADWPQWRGPSRDGQVPGAVFPGALSDSNVRKQWRVDLGPGYSGPIVVGDRVYTTETEERANEVVRALDRKTGKEIWRASWAGAMSVPFFAKANGDWIRATPASDGERLYVAGMRDVLVCLDAATGKELWRFDFVSELKTPEPAFGFVSSPLLDGDSVYVQAGAGLCKLNKKSGKLLWRTLTDDGGMSGSAFASPIVATLAGEKQLVVQTRTQLAGVALADGKELWSQPVTAFRGMNILTPTVHQGGVFTSAYGGVTQLFAVDKEGGSYQVSERWSLKEQGYMTSPVVLDGVGFELNRDQRLIAVDLATGSKLWAVKDKFGKYWSLVTDGKKVLALDQKGELLLFQPSREAWNVIGRMKVSESDTWAHLAVADDQVFIRDLNGITCWQWGE
jgi:outer membrane protein assembly factor BamB